MIHSYDGDSVHLRRGESSPVHEWLSRASSIPVEEVPIELLLPGCSPRIEAGTSADHVRLLVETESPLPAIIVHRTTMRVIDGAHRLQAAREQGRATIAVKYFDGTDDDAFALAVQVNVSHGLPLSLAERKAAARRLVASHPLWSDRLIASVIGLSHKTVGVERRRSGGESTRLNSRVGRDGKVHRLTVSEGREVAVEIIRNNPAASLREISREAGISVGTAKSVRDRLTRPGYRAARPGPVGEQAAGCGGAAVPATDGSCAPIGHESPIKNQMVGPQHSAGTGNATSTQELILRTLRNDPALRFNDKGKVLLRRLALSFTDIHALQRHAAEAPGHTRLALAKLARANARSWLDLAARLDNGLDRARPDSDVDRTA